MNFMKVRKLMMMVRVFSVWVCVIVFFVFCLDFLVYGGRWVRLF